MNGPDVFSFTIREIPGLLRQTLENVGWDLESVDSFVLHQANKFMLLHLAKKCKIPMLFGQSLSTELCSTIVRVSANWKVVVENSIESYHTGCVHPETLGVDRSYRFKIKTGPTFTRYEEAISAAVAAKWARIKKVFASRPISSDDYIFYSLFPTFSIDTLRGATYALNVIRPVSLTETEIHSRVFATRLSPPELEQSALVRAFNGYATSVAPLVVEQDKTICENVQRGLFQARFRASLSEEEERILAFQRYYHETFARFHPLPAETVV